MRVITRPPTRLPRIPSPIDFIRFSHKMAPDTFLREALGTRARAGTLSNAPALAIHTIYESDRSETVR